MPRTPPSRTARPTRPTPQPAAGRPRPPNRGRSGRVDPRKLFLVVGLLLTALGVVAWRWGAHTSWLVAYLLAVNLTTAVLYGYDKRAAVAGRLRVPERTLHLWAFAGGTPAAYASQRFFRHKTIKGSFRVRFWTIFAVQLLLVLAWWYWSTHH